MAPAIPIRSPLITPQPSPLSTEPSSTLLTIIQTLSLPPSKTSLTGTPNPLSEVTSFGSAAAYDKEFVPPTHHRNHLPSPEVALLWIMHNFILLLCVTAGVSLIICLWCMRESVASAGLRLWTWHLDKQRNTDYGYRHVGLLEGEENGYGYGYSTVKRGKTRKLGTRINGRRSIYPPHFLSEFESDFDSDREDEDRWSNSTTETLVTEQASPETAEGGKVKSILKSSAAAAAALSRELRPKCSSTCTIPSTSHRAKDQKRKSVSFDLKPEERPWFVSKSVMEINTERTLNGSSSVASEQMQERIRVVESVITARQEEERQREMNFVCGMDCEHIQFSGE